MSDDKTKSTSIKFSPKCDSAEISRVALASILRIHKIDPAVVSELAISMQQKLNELSVSGSWIEIEFQTFENRISAEIRADNDSFSIGANW